VVTVIAALIGLGVTTKEILSSWFAKAADVTVYSQDLDTTGNHLVLAAFNGGGTASHVGIERLVVGQAGGPARHDSTSCIDANETDPVAAVATESKVVCFNLSGRTSVAKDGGFALLSVEIDGLGSQSGADTARSLLTNAAYTCWIEYSQSGVSPDEAGTDLGNKLCRKLFK
jgi:hypothetical protein